MRSPIWFRLISDVPPAIDMARCMSVSVPDMAPAPSRRGVGAGQLGQDGGRLVAVLGQDQLGDVALRPPPPATARWALRRLSTAMAWVSAA